MWVFNHFENHLKVNLKPSLHLPSGTKRSYQSVETWVLSFYSKEHFSLIPLGRQKVLQNNQYMLVKITLSNINSKTKQKGEGKTLQNFKLKVCIKDS